MARKVLGIALVLFVCSCAPAIAEEQLITAYVDGAVAQLMVSDGTDFHVALAVAHAMDAAYELDDVNLSVSPTGIAADKSAVWVLIAVDDSTDDGDHEVVLISFSPNTPFDVMSAFAEAFNAIGHDSIRFISEQTLESLLIGDEQSPD